MKICNGCGGYVGRDCFNPIECEQIARNMNYDAQSQIQELTDQNTKLVNALKAVKHNLIYGSWDIKHIKHVIQSIESELEELNIKD